MRRIFNKKISQSIVELSIFGALMLGAFSFLLSIIQKLNWDQYELMGNFRRALKQAHDKNTIVSVTTLIDHKGESFTVPERDGIFVSSSSHVHWAVPSQNITKTETNRIGGSETYTDIDEKNDPKRKYFAYYSKGGSYIEPNFPEELNIDKDIEGVDRTYRKSYSGSYSWEENEKQIVVENKIGEGETHIIYNLKGQKELSTNQNITGNVSSTLKINKDDWSLEFSE